jgi:hypothetical protein
MLQAHAKALAVAQAQPMPSRVDDGDRGQSGAACSVFAIAGTMPAPPIWLCVQWFSLRNGKFKKWHAH